MFTLHKSERLCSKLVINQLFNEGKSFYESPFKVFWLESNINSKDNLIQVLISIPKKNIKKAVERNYIKRTVKEAYRLNKHIITEKLEPQKKTGLLALVYTGKQIHNWQFIQNKIILILQRLPL